MTIPSIDSRFSVSDLRRGRSQVDVAAAVSVITEMYPGSDGVRTAELRTAKGMQEAGLYRVSMI